MLTWCVILFLLGIAAFLDSMFSYGDIFRRVNSVLFMLVSLGLLVRTTTKMRIRQTEGYIARIEQLEDEVRRLSAAKKPDNVPVGR